MDKELAGWSHPKSCSQWLDVQVESSYEWGPSRGRARTFISDTDSGTEGTLSRSAGSTQLSGAVGLLEGRGDIPRDHDRLDEWSCANLLKSNKAKCEALHLGQSLISV